MTTAEQLRKLASDLRKASEQVQQERTQKCAQVLVAVQGLNALRRRLVGEDKR